ncbi:MAG: adenylate cyclase [Paraglaciecola sp.]|jgi:adenylate cyclase
MPIEIERKFLLKNSKWRDQVNNGKEIKQGYLNSNANRTVRVRTKGKLGFMTVKSKTINATRKEYEYEIPIQDAKELLLLCEQPLVEKVRFEIIHNQKIWEVDEFKGINEGLIVAEIELEDEQEKIELPDWIGEEVTLNKKYYNSSLIANPYSKWESINKIEI